MGGSYTYNGMTIPYTPIQEPAVATEEGYKVGSQYLCDYNGNYPVTADIAAKQQLDYWLDGSVEGLTMLFDYKLINTDGSGFGLFDAGNNPTTAATDIHYFNAILNEPAVIKNVTLVTSPAITWSISGADTNTYAATYEYSTTKEMVVVWHEPQLCTNQKVPASGSVNTIPPLPITLTASAQNAVTITEYDPTIGSAAATQTSSSGEITDKLVDHPLMFFIEKK